ncbi:acyl-CoA synthetase [soil metagenome]
MPAWLEHPLATLADVERFETAVPLHERIQQRSVYDVLVGAAAEHGDRPALTMVMTGDDDEDPRRVSFAQLLALVTRTANLFTSLGGERPGVAFLLPTLVETHAVLWGAETAGYAVPMNFLLQPDDLQALLEESGATILVALGPHPVLDIWEKAVELQRRAPGVTLVRVAPPGTPGVEGVVDLTALAEQPGDRLLAPPPQTGDEVAAYFHTGGTTGVPKLAAHTHRGQLVAAYGCAAMLDLGPDDVVTGTLPMFHVAGTILMGISTFLSGSELLLLSPGGLRNPVMVQRYWHLCETYGVTVAGGVPTSLGALAEVPTDGADLQLLRMALTGASPMPAAVRERFETITGLAVKEIYGMTEASGLIACNPVRGSGGTGSVGLRFPYTGLDVRRLDGDGRLGEVCDTGELGVVVVSGPTVSPGYRDPSHGTGTVQDGVLTTGDLGRLDPEGRLVLEGRSKDLIIRSGHNIDPQMIESALQRHPDVMLAAAVGLPDAYAGELPVCYVELKPGGVASEDELRRFAEREISERPAWPREVHVVPQVPVTAVGKIFKPSLRQDAVEQVVRRLLEEAGLEGSVTASGGGSGLRGLRVEVALHDASAADCSRLQGVLDGYLMASVVTG